MTVASLIVAIVAVVISLATFVVNRHAIRDERRDRRQQIEDEWTREWAKQRPVVYPLALHEWAYRTPGSPYEVHGPSRLLPLKNGGPGVALNVRGEVTSHAPGGDAYTREILAGPIAAGDLLNARIAPSPGVEHWENASGVIRYGDLAGGEYETRFECSLGPGNELVMGVHEPEQVRART